MESIDFKRYRIFFDKDAAIVRDKACETLTNLLKEYREHPVLLLLSGGSAFELLFGISEDVLGPHITLGVLDERFSTDPTINNFSLLEKTDFFQRALGAGAQSINTKVLTGDDTERLAARFETALRTWRATHTDGVIIITQGIGHDGHTAGIMPYSEDEEFFETLFLDDAHWVCGYEAGAKNQHAVRVTATIPFLQLVDYSLVYCIGGNKREALGRVIASKGTLAETPARVLRKMREVEIFTDISAASLQPVIHHWNLDLNPD